MEHSSQPGLWKPEGAKGPGGTVIPENIITRPPTAELRDNQKDEDSLPAYAVLDPIHFGGGNTTYEAFAVGMPIAVALFNYIVPLQIGARDVAFPRLNLLSYYMFTFGGLILLASFLSPGGSAAFGWYAYSPLTSAIYSPGIGADMWIMGLVLSGLGTILSGVNFITTIFCMRAPGMTMFRMPMFTWNALLTSMLVLMAFPVLAAALLIAAAALGTYIVWEAKNLGMSKWQMARMSGNVGLNWVLGLASVVPVVGVIPTLLFRSNSRNLKIIRRHLDKHHADTATVEGAVVQKELR